MANNQNKPNQGGGRGSNLSDQDRNRSGQESSQMQGRDDQGEFTGSESMDERRPGSQQQQQHQRGTGNVGSQGGQGGQSGQGGQGGQGGRNNPGRNE